ncbi:MAG: carbamoyl-phosphate synthase large subunit, partial [Chloroflexi bacterium]|nr:carbamoyl-phosphate synthase large subunit [Chloroflexota bacterium]
MSIERLLIANRGEIAVRITRAAAEMGIHTVAVFPADDATSLHTRVADQAHALTGSGAAAYLDGAQIVAAAVATGCDAIHPGYGFLSESAAFARLCADAGITYVGPRPEALDLFGDKVRARGVAQEHAVPVLEGADGETSLEDARAFFDALPDGSAMIVKAVAGGGGRGVRMVAQADELDAAYAAAAREAQAAFGNPALYVERFLPRARHIEVQVAGDRLGAVSHLWERDCSLQRRHQKVLEYAPSPNLSPELRERMLEAAVRLAGATRYENLGTIEFLVDASTGALAPRDESFFFIEANARLQVEHTVTEAVTGIDLVRLQIRLAEGATLAELNLTQDRVPAPRGFAIQARVNMETMSADGTTRPSGGTLTAFEAPSGPGVRTDTFGYTGYRTSPRYDSLLAKVITHSTSPDFADATRKADRALAEFRIEGAGTNIPFLRALLAHPDFAAGQLYTRFVDDHIAELAGAAAGERRKLFFELPPPEAPVAAPATPATPAVAAAAGA